MNLEVIVAFSLLSLARGVQGPSLFSSEEKRESSAA
jgi:hypothetical protein